MKIHKLQTSIWMRSECWKFRGGVQEWDQVTCKICLAKRKPEPLNKRRRAGTGKEKGK